MATFLALCQSVHRKMRGGNASPGSQPTAIPVPATPAQDQMVYDIVDAVQLAWENLQNLHSGWLWMWKQGLLQLTPHVRLYTISDLLVKIPDYGWLKTFDAAEAPIYLNLYDTTSAPAARVGQPVWYSPYENWRGLRDRPPITIEAQPRYFTQWPDYTLEFDPTPNVSPGGGGYTLMLDYRQANQLLTGANTVPNLPLRFHELIAWMAVEIICETRGSTALLASLAKREIYGEGLRQGRLSQLESDQLPVFLIANRYA